MTYNPDIHHRRSIRLKGYDYSSGGAYFVTVCVQDRQCLFGDAAEGEMKLNDAGRMVWEIWDGLRGRFPYMESDQFVVMPNHVHGIILLTDSVDCRGESRIRPQSCIHPESRIRPKQQIHSDRGDFRPNQGDHKDRPYGTGAGTLGRIVQAFKSTTTRDYIVGVRRRGWPPFVGKLWQRNYYERVLRDEEELLISP